MKKVIGYMLLVTSFIVWGAIAALPFMDLSMAMMTAWTTGLFIAGEVAFVASMFLLGKDFFMHIKEFFSKVLKRD